MVVTTVMIQVNKENIDDFIRATIPNCEASTAEPGNRRFDLLQNMEDPGQFILYEAYDSQEAAAAHKESSHYKTWRETVSPHMKEPRRGIAYRAIRPE